MRAFDAVIRIAGGCVAAALGAMTALVEAFWTPELWVVPVGAALLGGAALYWFAQTTIARVWAWVVPAVPWFLVMILAVASTTGGDLIANSWTGLATFGAGAVGFFVPAAFTAPSKGGRRVEGRGPDGGDGGSPGR